MTTWAADHPAIFWPCLLGGFLLYLWGMSLLRSLILARRRQQRRMRQYQPFDRPLRFGRNLRQRQHREA